jgi:hypothetical protein
MGIDGLTVAVWLRLPVMPQFPLVIVALSVAAVAVPAG